MDDHELISAFQAGDDGAFAELVRRHQRQVYRVARSVLGDHAQADEAAQEAFLKAHAGLARFEGRSSFKTWMYRIAMNAAFDLRSRESTQARARQEAEREAAAESRRTPAGPRPLEALLHEERLAELREALAALPERQRLTISLRVREGLSLAEIAETLGCPVGTVKANIHHAVNNLRKLLAPEDASVKAAAAGRDG